MCSNHPVFGLKKNQKMVRPDGKVRVQDGSPITVGLTIISGEHIPHVVNHEKHKTVVNLKLELPFLFVLIECV